MSEKKRKRTSKEPEQSNKKQQTQSNITVKHLEPTEIKPVIGDSPGITVPTNLKFKAFSKKTKNGSSDMLLHSAEHATLDYTATEGDHASKQHLKHYIAVFNPSTGQIEIAEAQSVTIRSSVRNLQAPRVDEDDIVPVTNYSSRAALTEAFGTKKSKKAVQSIAENRLLAQGNEEADNPVSAVMLSSLADEDSVDSLPNGVAALSNKPVPKPDLNTNDISQVYAVQDLVIPSPQSQTLKSMPTGSWVARISSKKDVHTRLRFVSYRVGYLVKHLLESPESSDPNIKQHLQILRYIQILVEVHNYVQTLPRRKPVPPINKWPDTAFSEGTPMTLLPSILSRFFVGQRLPTTYAITLLRTTIFALTLHIPPPSLQTGQGTLVTQVLDISMDMAVDSSETKKLYRELGCKVEPATEAELARWGYEKLSKKSKKEDGPTKNSKVLFAKLRLPLNFPKVSRGKPQGRR